MHVDRNYISQSKEQPVSSVINSSQTVNMVNSQSQVLPSIFRPFNTTATNNKNVITCNKSSVDTKEQNCLPVINSERTSRTKVRGERRAQSMSLPRVSQLSGDSRGNPSVINRHTGKNSSQQTVNNQQNDSSAGKNRQSESRDRTLNENSENDTQST